MTAKQARLQIRVPSLDVEAIRERSAAGRSQARIRRLAVALAASLGIIGGAVAFASIGGGIHLWLSGNKVEATVESFTMIREPMAADVQRIVSSATFPVKFPTGVPREAHGVWIAFSPADKPDLITIEYRDAAGKPYAGVTIVDNTKIRRDIGEMPGGPVQGVVSKGVHWQIDGETVITQSRVLSGPDLDRVKSAMRNETAAQSQAAFEAMLPKIVIMQVPPAVADAAANVAPPGRNVLFGKWDIHQIPTLAAKGKALRDSRTVNLVHIPQVHGEPDYRNATLEWPKSVAVPAEGVRVVASALRHAKIGPNCACAILVHQSGSTYIIWKIGIAPPYKTERLLGP